MLTLLAFAIVLASPAGSLPAPQTSVQRVRVGPSPTPGPPAALPAEGLVLPAVPAIEPGVRAPQITPPSGDIVGVDGAFVGLSLDAAIGMALVRNTDLAVSLSNRRIAAYGIVAAKGAYDLTFSVEPQYTFSRQAAISSFESGPGGMPIQQINAGATGGLSTTTTSGGRLSASTTAQRVDNNTTVDSYEPYYQTALQLQYTQPLARGLAIDANRRQLQLARMNADLSTDNALLTASNTVDAVLVTYYNLVAAWKNVAIQEDALRAAKVQSQSNARLVRQGQAARVDVIESDTQVSEFQDDVYSAIANVASLQNALKQLLLSDPADPLWSANLVPTSPISSVVPEPALSDIVAAGLRDRPEAAQLRENFREQDLSIAYAKDQTKPQIDLNLSITENGFAGAPTNPDQNPFFSVIGAQTSAIDRLIARSNADNPGQPPLVPLSILGLGAPLYPGTIGGLGQSYHTALLGDFPQYAISATIGFPLQNRAAKAAYAAELERRHALETQQRGFVARLQAEARNAIQQYRSARSRLIAASAGRAAAQEVAASEERKFRVGQSTTFLVLQRQVAVANERGRELQAQSDVQKALVELDRVSGAILVKNGVDVGTFAR